MKKEELRIVFMGTPQFAVESLKQLVEGGYHIVGVVTMPDKAIGRHQSELQASPVKQYALTKGLPILQPESLKSPSFVEELRALNAHLQVVVAFRMLPEVVWAMPPLGTFNLHASLLPQYRGAAPINWAIINGEVQTGVTTFFLQHEIDTGNIIARRTIDISPTDNAETVHDRLMMLGAQLTTETVQAIINETLTTIPQEELAANEELHPAPKIFKDTCRINWCQSAKRIYDFVRGLSPYPAAWTELHNGERTTAIKIFDAEMHIEPHTQVCGTMEKNDNDTLCVYCEDGYLSIKSLQPAGKKRMPIADFLRGFRFEEGMLMR